MQNDRILDKIFQMESRANPYPLFAELRKMPVSHQRVDMLSEPDIFFVSTYRDLVKHMRDPRITSDIDGVQRSGKDLPNTMFFDQLDGPAHQERRASLMHNFGPPRRPGYMEELRRDIEAITHQALDEMRGRTEVDFVADFAYRVPVHVICTILGVPVEDEPKFHDWSQAALSSLPRNEKTEEQKKAQADLAAYIGGLVAKRREDPADDFISAMVQSQKETGVSDEFIVLSGVALLVAGHETTVNLLASGIMLFLRNPQVIEQIRANPDLIIPAVEEVLRLEPPSQLMTGRMALEDIEISGTRIPKGSRVGFSIAGANRDPAVFEDPDSFRLDRTGAAHATFGSGPHFCFGAPLARLEGQIALKAFVERVQGARLLQDPPPYRESPLLRGPSELRATIEGIR